MTGPIIPAELWPEWADRHCWDADGGGFFFGTERIRKGWVTDYGRSGIPMPADWDWRVPVMRPQPAIDLEHLRKSIADAMNFIAHFSWAWNGTGQHPNTIHTELQSLLALIDGQKAAPRGPDQPDLCDLEWCSLCGLHFTSERELADHRHQVDDGSDDDERQPAKGEGE